MKIFTRKKIIIFILIIFVIFILASVLRKYRASRGSFLRPKAGSVVEAVYAIGTVKSDNTYNLRLSMSSIIKKLYLSEGDTVQKGSRLLMTDTSIILYAPFGGTITRINYKEGEMIMPNQIVLSLADLDRMHVIVSLDQESILRIKKNQNAELSFENLREKKINGIVDRVYPSNGEFLTKIRVKKIPEEILPEMTCDVAIEIGKKDKALMIPMSAINKGVITLIRNGQTQKVKVDIGVINDNWGEVLDDKILTDDRVLVPPKKIIDPEGE